MPPVRARRSEPNELNIVVLSVRFLQTMRQEVSNGNEGK